MAPRVLVFPSVSVPGIRPPTRFLARAATAGTVVILIFAAGMAVSIRQFEAVSAAQVTHVRGEEYEGSSVERLRWSGELIVSAGRGYLISGDPALLARLRAAESTFDQGVRNLRGETLSAREDELVTAAEQSARDFRRKQDNLLADRDHFDARTLVRRFEGELLPLRHPLQKSLDLLADAKEADLKQIYRQAEADRSRVALRLYALLGVLTLTGFAITWFLAKRLADSYRAERDALDAAERAVGARDELLGIVAHDLRNPLGAIAMKAALLRKVADSEKVRQQAESIENITMRTEYLIKSMLDVATIEAGRFTVHPGTCDVEGLLHETMQMFGPLAAAKKIRLEQRAAQPDLTIPGDRERILEVLSNLVGNALKFTPAGGEITTSIERESASRVRFTVSDTGPGIAKEHLPHLFDRFWKHERHGERGTGLGLFIAKGIVEAHGGTVWAENDPGGGARFQFTLPTEPPSPAATSSVARAERATNLS